MLRLTGGEYKNKKISTIRGVSVRPTSSLVKESIFNILGNKINDANILDLFAGTGNIGLEALSRGAKKVFFVDNSVKSVKVIKNNINNLGYQDDSIVIKKDANESIKILEKMNIKFDIIYLDPPYDFRFKKNIIEETVKRNIINEEGLIILECDKNEKIDSTLINIEMIKEKKYGNTKIFIYKLRS